MKTLIPTLIAFAITLPALAGDQEAALRKQLADLEKQIGQLRNTQKALYEKRSAVLKNLHTAKVAAAKKRVESAKKLTKPTTKKPAVKKSAKSVKSVELIQIATINKNTLKCTKIH